MMDMLWLHKGHCVSCGYGVSMFAEMSGEAGCKVSSELGLPEIWEGYNEDAGVMKYDRIE